MSSMDVDVIYRLPVMGTFSEEEALEFACNYLNVAYAGEFYFDPEENDGFSFSLFEDRLYLDYYLYKERNVNYINLDITCEMAEDFFTKADETFETDSELYKRLELEGKFKFLYYYNGGCAGVTEVE